MSARAVQALPPAPAVSYIADYTRALLNILEDASEEKGLLEETQKAVFNILEDSSGEKGQLEDSQRAVLNILEDFSGEKVILEGTQKAMLNILEDFDVERAKTEAINKVLSENEERLWDNLHGKENLIKEIHHRVKNNLQIIHSMLNLQMAYVRDEAAIKLFKETMNRVYSIALIHEKLYQSESLANIDLPEYLRSLTNNLFLSYGVSEKVIRPKIDVVSVALDVDTLIPCALIVTELISNSLKYAFSGLSERGDGKAEIHIELRRSTDNKLVLTVGDNGEGMPDSFDIENSKSLGLKLVNVLVKQLRGTIQKVSGGTGTEYTITFQESRTN
ncbi:MAG: histidine kinase dimerization/phosphoacceptor domain -containing protein [Nitrospira sp.]|nr:histidine kinase dimerization/phosphoacceptor domain -containing protein [Nitrospira sp.]